MSFFVIFLPSVVIYSTYYLTTLFCSSYPENQSRIPSFIFAYAWAFLLSLFGIAWFFSKKASVLYSSLLLSLAIYLPLSLCFSFSGMIQKILLLLPILMVCILLRKEFMNHHWVSFFCMLPLLFWLMLVTVY